MRTVLIVAGWVVCAVGAGILVWVVVGVWIGRHQ